MKIKETLRGKLRRPFFYVIFGSVFLLLGLVLASVHINSIVARIENYSKIEKSSLRLGHTLKDIEVHFYQVLFSDKNSEVLERKTRKLTTKLDKEYAEYSKSVMLYKDEFLFHEAVEYKPVIHDFIEQINSILEMRTQDKEKARVFFNSKINYWQSRIDELVSNTRVVISKRLMSLKKDFYFDKKLFFGFGIFCIFYILIVIIYYNFNVTETVIDPITKLTGQVTDIVNDEDYEVQLDIPSEDEIGKLAEQFNKLTNMLISSFTQLTHSAKLASIGEVSANIAHEINNPLSIIKISIKLLRRSQERGELDPAVLSKNLEKIDKTVLRVEKIVNGLRNIARESSGEENQNIVLRDMFMEVFDLVIDRFKKSNVALDIDLDKPQFNTVISGDKIQISQVIINLLNNACDAASDYQEKWVKVFIQSNDEYTQIKIVDSGKGIPQEVQDKMFNPFFTSKGVGKGTGLGLAISQKIIRKHEGDLYVDSDSPNTCFVIKLFNADFLSQQKLKDEISEEAS